MGEFQKRIKPFLEKWDVQEWSEEEFQKIFKEAKKEIRENTLPTNRFVNLGDYVLVDKKTLEKWFGE